MDTQPSSLTSLNEIPSIRPKTNTIYPIIKFIYWLKGLIHLEPKELIYWVMALLIIPIQT